MARIIIIGAGPAGTSAALQLVRSRRHEVVLLERCHPPRSKTCAGGISPWALDLLACMDLREPVLAQAQIIRGAAIWAPRGGPLRLRGRLSAAVLPRVRFDNLLVERARLGGAEVREGVSATGLHPLPGGRGVGLLTSAGPLEADAVIVATGAAGRLGHPVPRKEQRLFGIMTRYIGMAGLSDAVEIFLDQEVRPYYAWVFPEGPTEANLGLCFRPQPEGPGAHRLLEGFLARHLADRMHHAERRGRIMAHPIDASVWPRRLVDDGVIYAGEAACLADPLTGEGIYYALASGQIAACSLEEIFQRGSRPTRRALQLYVRRLRVRLVPRLAGSQATLLALQSPLAGVVGGLLANTTVQRTVERVYTRC